MNMGSFLAQYSVSCYQPGNGWAGQNAHTCCHQWRIIAPPINCPREAHRSMANQSRRLRPDDLDGDHEAVVAVQSILKYQPFNVAYSAQTLVDLNAARDKAQHEEI